LTVAVLLSRLLLFVDKARVGVNKPINEVLTIILSVVVLCRNIY